jgi:hypothetical protein
MVPRASPNANGWDPMVDNSVLPRADDAHPQCERAERYDRQKQRGSQPGGARLRHGRPLCCRARRGTRPFGPRDLSGGFRLAPMLLRSAVGSIPRTAQTLRNPKGQVRSSSRSQSRASMNWRRRGPYGSIVDSERTASSRIAATSASSGIVPPERAGYWQGRSTAGCVSEEPFHAVENGFIAVADSNVDKSLHPTQRTRVDAG